VLACAGADIALILAGVGGMGALVLQWPLLLQVLRFGGAAFLLWYGVQAGLRAWRGGSVLAAAEAQAGSARQVLLTCLAFTLLNPHVYLDTVVLLGSLSTRYPGDLRWAATLLNHAVFADETNARAREVLAEVYTRLAFQSEAGTWRNIYLTGAQELRDGPVKLPAAGFSPDVLSATTTSMLLDFAAVRVNPDKAAAQAFRLNLELTDRGETHLITVGDGVMVHEEGVVDPNAQATARMKRPELLMTLLAGVPVAVRVESGDIVLEGDTSLYPAFVDLIEPLVPNFPIVTP